MLLNKGPLSANTNRTKTPLTWKLKYKIYFQPECLLPIHMKWRSLVWMKNELNLLFSSREHKSAPGLHPAKPTSCQITEGQCKTQTYFRGRFFCHKVTPNYPASRNLSMQANNIGWGRVTQQDTGGGVEKGKLKRETCEQFLSTVAIQTHHKLQRLREGFQRGSKLKGKRCGEKVTAGKWHSNQYRRGKKINSVTASSPWKDLNQCLDAGFTEYKYHTAPGVPTGMTGMTPLRSTEL